MPLPAKILTIFTGTDPKLHRLLRYWAATCLFYSISIALLLMEIHAGTAAREPGYLLSAVGAGGVVFFYLLVRFSHRLRIQPWHLAFAQAVFAVLCNVAGYAITGPLRGASLVILLVVIVFCTFSLRPRQTFLLCGLAIASLAATSAGLVGFDPVAYPVAIEAFNVALGSISMIAVATLTAEMSRLRNRLRRQKEELLQAVAKIQTLATVDELTSLANRRHMNAVLQEQSSNGGAVCIALLDIDYFKNVNDRYGHAVGDSVLRLFADTARAELRANDVLARWGGEEFLLMLPETALADAVRVLERMAARFSACSVDGIDPSIHITFSAGAAQRAPGEALDTTISRADKAMYQAKSSGRNRIVSA
jgi:diguanylate cyclase (GGDEF)-like protein